MEGFFQLGAPAWQIVLRSVGIYLALLIGLRLFGKREVGQFTIFDLAFVLLVANAVQPAMTGPDNSFVGGVLIIATLLVANWSVGWLRLHTPVFREAFESHPTVIAEDGRWFTDVMDREGVNLQEAEMALREHGVENVQGARLVVLESDGGISVVPRESGGKEGGHRRRVRYRKQQT
ncbi:MAG TPA: YetF domain-containing protein [Chloroflexota bacterium]|nr:YetF domain-containing protein [Chloroflexota bacterium]